MRLDDLVGDYRITGALGCGGMGTVYRVEHIITKRVEALKVLSEAVTAESDPEHFVREIQVQARLKHPNIASVYNAFRAGEDLVLVMECVEGESLQRRLERGRLPLAATLDYSRQILRALAYAHDEGVIHRDVAPANIIITPEGTAKLTDFGLAHSVADARQSNTGAPAGSLWYMSPEQVTSSFVDRRTDIYSMGAVVAEMLTGRKLFECESAFEVMKAHVEAVPAPPSQWNRDVSPALDRVVQTALAKDPRNRYQTAGEFLDALEKAFAAVPAEGHRSLRLPARMAAMIAVPAMLAAGIYTAGRSPEASRLAHWARNSFNRLKHTQAPAQARQASTPKPAPAKPSSDEAPVPPKAARMSRHIVPAGGIRISGNEAGEASAPRRADCPVVVVERPARTDAIHLAESAAEPVTQKVDAPRTEAPADAVQPPRKGNRFVRALSKINPFRKNTKSE